jgi:hypothetical protein
VLKYYGKGGEGAQLHPGLKPMVSPLLPSGSSNLTVNIIVSTDHLQLIHKDNDDDYDEDDDDNNNNNNNNNEKGGKSNFQKMTSRSSKKLLLVRL